MRHERMAWLFHKPFDHSNRADWLRYRFLKLFFRSSKAIARIVPGKERKLAWKELMFKIQAFTFFEHINIILNIDSDPQQSVSLRAVLEMVRETEPAYLLWATEGVGYIYAEKAFKEKEPPTGLLQDKNLPRWSLGPLHSGMGMLFASRFLQDFKNGNLYSDPSRALEQYLYLSRDNSIPGYAEIPVESLGFISRLLYPGELLVIDRLLQNINQELVAYFWHGVGRALCFLPENLWPGRSFPWRAIEIAIKETPHETGHFNVFSGLGWPLTLVNIREPRIMENVLKYHRDCLLENNAFSSGVSSAMVLLMDSVGDNTLINSFCDHKPDCSDPRIHENWIQLIKNPCEKALTDFYPYLKKRNCWSEVFKYRD